jgi:hypothetical protein
MTNFFSRHQCPIMKGRRGFSFCGPQVWNKLPYDIRTCNEVSKFKEKLNYYLFSEAFGAT